ncbi:MAG: PIN domain-containing protein [Woeseia sp.]
MAKLRVYLDTSVLSAYYDDRAPDRQAQTEEFWKRLGDFEAATSELTREEIGQTQDPGRRSLLLTLLDELTIYPITEETKELARHYVTSGVFSLIMLNDALHVAAAVLTRQEVLLSWNFRHMVNRLRRARVNEVNIARRLSTIEILAPPEL